MSAWAFLPLLFLLLLLVFAVLLAMLQEALAGIRWESLEKLLQRHVEGARRLEALLRRRGTVSLSVALAEGAT